MKKAIIPLLLTFALAGCPSVPLSTDGGTKTGGTVSAAQQRADVDAITAEAQRVADLVKAGKINRTQAADMLGDFRLKRIGQNMLDDDTFATYRRITVQRESRRITQNEAHAIMETKLRDWRRRWVSMSQADRPANPAFTNFLLRLYNLPQLGQ